MYNFARSSIKMMEDAHEDLKIICYEVKKISKIDFDISCVFRSSSEQNKKFKQGKSKIDGIINKGKHNKKPSEAADIYCYKDHQSKASYTVHQMAYIAGLFDAVAYYLYNSSKISHLIRWGGNWDQDGIIITDQDFDDLPHFELYKP